LGGGGRSGGENPPGTAFQAVAGNVNTGGGGGAGAHVATSASGAGGSGVAIFAHPAYFTVTANTTGSPNVTTSGNSVYYTFTGPGTITFVG
jgi:hypothetical protein